MAAPPSEVRALIDESQNTYLDDIPHVTLLSSLLGSLMNLNSELAKQTIKHVVDNGLQIYIVDFANLVNLVTLDVINTWVAQVLNSGHFVIMIVKQVYDRHDNLIIYNANDVQVSNAVKQNQFHIIYICSYARSIDICTHNEFKNYPNDIDVPGIDKHVGKCNVMQFRLSSNIDDYLFWLMSMACFRLIFDYAYPPGGSIGRQEGETKEEFKKRKQEMMPEQLEGEDNKTYYARVKELSEGRMEAKKDCAFKCVNEHLKMVTCDKQTIKPRMSKNIINIDSTTQHDIYLAVFSKKGYARKADIGFLYYFEHLHTLMRSYGNRVANEEETDGLNKNPFMLDSDVGQGFYRYLRYMQEHMRTCYTTQEVSSFKF